MISCILLTAGESSRFGIPKALAQIHSQKAIELLQEKLITSIVDEIVIVTGAYEDVIKPHVFNHSKVTLVHNKDYKFGQTSSFQKGLNSVDKNASGFMLLPVDCPFVLTDTINTLIRRFQATTPNILIPCYQNKKGHPPIFHAQLKDALLKLPATQGLNSLMTEHSPQILSINDPGIVQSFNTKEELESILKK